MFVPSRCGRLISGAWQSNGGGVAALRTTAIVASRLASELSNSRYNRPPALDDQAASPRRQQAGVAHELDGRAQPLLGMHEQRATGEVVAGPRRLPERAGRGREARHPPAPLILGEALAKAAEEQQQHRPIAARRGVRGIGGDGSVVHFQRLAVSSALL